MSKTMNNPLMSYRLMDANEQKLYSEEYRKELGKSDVSFTMRDKLQCQILRAGVNSVTTKSVNELLKGKRGTKNIKQDVSVQVPVWDRDEEFFLDGVSEVLSENMPANIPLYARDFFRLSLLEDMGELSPIPDRYRIQISRRSEKKMSAYIMVVTVFYNDPNTENRYIVFTAQPTIQSGLFI